MGVNNLWLSPGTRSELIREPEHERNEDEERRAFPWRRGRRVEAWVFSEGHWLALGAVDLVVLIWLVAGGKSLVLGVVRHEYSVQDASEFEVGEEASTICGCPLSLK
jgi:hypothetical protein